MNGAEPARDRKVLEDELRQEVERCAKASRKPLRAGGRNDSRLFGPRSEL